MQVILKEKIPNLGNLGDVIKVKPGHARNFLLPQGKALRATKANTAVFEAQRAELEKAEHEKLAQATSLAEKLADVTVTIASKTGEEGRLFGSIGSRDIASKIAEQGFQVAKHQVRLPHGVFRTVGEYTVTLHLHTDVEVELKLNIVPE